jgi:hypothetical protein
MQTNDLEARYVGINLTRRQEAFVIIRVPAGKSITEAHIDEATAKTLGDYDWTTVGKVERGKRFQMEKEEAEEFHFLDPYSVPTFAVRAAEIGVTTLTLRKWRDDHGVDIFNDAAVISHIAKQKNYNPRIQPKFRHHLKF